MGMFATLIPALRSVLTHKYDMAILVCIYAHCPCPKSALARFHDQVRARARPSV